MAKIVAEGITKVVTNPETGKKKVLHLGKGNADEMTKLWASRGYTEAKTITGGVSLTTDPGTGVSTVRIEQGKTENKPEFTDALGQGMSVDPNIAERTDLKKKDELTRAYELAGKGMVYNPFTKKEEFNISQDLKTQALQIKTLQEAEDKVRIESRKIQENAMYIVGGKGQEQSMRGSELKKMMKKDEIELGYAKAQQIDYVQSLLQEREDARRREKIMFNPLVLFSDMSSINDPLGLRTAFAIGYGKLQGKSGKQIYNDIKTIREGYYERAKGSDLVGGMLRQAGETALIYIPTAMASVPITSLKTGIISYGGQGIMRGLQGYHIGQTIKEPNAENMFFAVAPIMGEVGIRAFSKLEPMRQRAIVKEATSFFEEAPRSKYNRYNPLLKRVDGKYFKKIQLPKEEQAKLTKLLKETGKLLDTKNKVKNIKLEDVNTIPRDTVPDLKKYAIKNKLITGGSLSNKAQMDTFNRMPNDWDIYGMNAGKHARNIANIIRLKGHKVSIKGSDIKINGRKAIQVHPLQMLEANVDKLTPFVHSDPLGYKYYHTVKTPEGMRILKLSTQMQRKLIGAFEQNKYRYSKDFPDYENILKEVKMVQKDPAWKRYMTDTELIEQSIKGIKEPESKIILDFVRERGNIVGGSKAMGFAVKSKGGTWRKTNDWDIMANNPVEEARILTSRLKLLGKDIQVINKGKGHIILKEGERVIADISKIRGKDIIITRGGVKIVHPKNLLQDWRAMARDPARQTRWAEKQADITMAEKGLGWKASKTLQKKKALLKEDRLTLKQQKESIRKSEKAQLQPRDTYGRFVKGRDYYYLGRGYNKGYYTPRIITEKGYQTRGKKSSYYTTAKKLGSGMYYYKRKRGQAYRYYPYNQQGYGYYGYTPKTKGIYYYEEDNKKAPPHSKKRTIYIQVQDHKGRRKLMIISKDKWRVVQDPLKNLVGKPRYSRKMNLLKMQRLGNFYGF